MRDPIISIAPNKWAFRYDDPPHPVTGKRQQKYKTVYGSKKDAQRSRRETLTAVETKSPVVTQLTVGEVFDLWNCAPTKGGVARAATTAYTNRTRFNKYVRPVLGNQTASLICGADLTQLYDSLLGEHSLSPRTVHHVHSNLRAMFNWACKRKHATTNPTLDADPPRVLLPPPTAPSLVDVQEHLKLLEVEEPMLGLAFRLIATIGIRRSEVVALRWDHIDFRNKVIDICEGVTYVPGVGVSTTATKTGLHGMAKFDLDDRTIELLGLRRAEFEKSYVNVGLEIPVDGYVLSVCPALGRMLLPDQLTKMFRKHNERHPELENIRPKDLRSFVSTSLQGEGMSETTASAVLRNTPQTTARHYRAAQIVVVRSATKVLARRLDENRKQ